MPTLTTHLTGHLTPAQEKTYVHLPFDVPVGAARLQVSYRYSEQISSDPTLSGGNTIDLGVFDERGIRFLEAGFRGWTGSERLTFTITPAEATPGYLAGPLNPGRWHVLLGLYKIAPAGCDYQVDIVIETGADLPQAEPFPLPAGDLPGSPPPALAAPWLRGELHCHTIHSDGKLSPAQLVERARARGLDFLAVSDHNSIAAQRELSGLENPGLVLIRGVEVTTFKGHFNVWGIPDWVDFRVLQPEDMRAALQFAGERGALTSCGHPKPFGPDWDYPEVRDYRCVEVWNGPWTGLNEVSLEYWLNQLAEGRRFTAVGGSDFHRPGQSAGGMDRDLGTPTNWVYLDGPASPSAILNAIRAGHVSLSGEPDGPFVDLRAGPGGSALGGDVVRAQPGGSLPVTVICRRGQGCTLRLLDQGGVRFEQPLGAAEETVTRSLPVEDSLYLRAELRDLDERVRALTNPVYLER